MEITNKAILNDEKANERQRVLYEILKERGDRYTRQIELYRRMNAYYPAAVGNYHDSYARVIMSKDISAINRSPQFECLIVSTTRGVKLATKEEARQMIAGRQTAAQREYLDLNIMIAKFARDGQKDSEGRVIRSFVGESECKS